MRTATDYAYTIESIGRWHRGRDHAEPFRFPALYTSERTYVAGAEFLRHIEDRRRQDGQPLDLRVDRYRTSELRVSLASVVDFRDPAVLELRPDDPYEDYDYDTPQLLAAEAHARGIEALLVWSAAIEPLGAADNLIILPDNLQPGSFFERPAGGWPFGCWHRGLSRRPEPASVANVGTMMVIGRAGAHPRSLARAIRVSPRAAWLALASTSPR